MRELPMKLHCELMPGNTMHVYVQLLPPGHAKAFTITYSGF